MSAPESPPVSFPNDLIQPDLIPGMFVTVAERHGYAPAQVLINTAVQTLKPWLLNYAENTPQDNTYLLRSVLSLAEPVRQVFSQDDTGRIIARAITIAETLPADMIPQASYDVALTAARVGQVGIARAIVERKHPSLSLSTDATGDRVKKREAVENAILASLVEQGKLHLASYYAQTRAGDSYSLIRLRYLLENNIGTEAVDRAQQKLRPSIARLVLRTLLSRWDETMGGDVQDGAIAGIVTDADFELKNLARSSPSARITSLQTVADVQLDCGKGDLARQTIQQALTLVQQQLKSKERTAQAQNPQFWFGELGIQAAKAGALREVVTVLRLIDAEPFARYWGDVPALKTTLRTKIFDALMEYQVAKGQSKAATFVMQHFPHATLVWKIPNAEPSITRQQAAPVEVQTMQQALELLARVPVINNVYQAGEAVRVLISASLQLKSAKAESHLQPAVVPLDSISVGFGYKGDISPLWHIRNVDEGGTKRRAELIPRLNKSTIKEQLAVLEPDVRRSKLINLLEALETLYKLPSVLVKDQTYLRPGTKGSGFGERLFSLLPPYVGLVETLDNLRIVSHDYDTAIKKHDDRSQHWNIPEVSLYAKLLAESLDLSVWHVRLPTSTEEVSGFIAAVRQAEAESHTLSFWLRQLGKNMLGKAGIKIGPSYSL